MILNPSDKAVFGHKQNRSFNQPGSVYNLFENRKYGADVKYQSNVDTVMAVFVVENMAQITKPNVINVMQYPIKNIIKQTMFEFEKIAVVEPNQGN